MDDRDGRDDSIEKRIFDVAVVAARRAGEVLLDHAGETLRVDAVTDHDVKLEVDRLCEEAITETIRDAFPDHAILAEEGGATEAAGAYRWIVDPLDGTANYFAGLPYYCTSIACFERPAEGEPTVGLPGLGRPVAGVVYAPPTDELFAARAGMGAWLNGRPIRAFEGDSLRETAVAVGFGKTDELGLHMLDVSARITKAVRKLRCLGAAAYDISNVACGRLSAFYERGLRTWDIAAGYVILAEAGGVLDADEFEATRWRVLAAGPGVIEAMREMTGSGRR